MTQTALVPPVTRYASSGEGNVAYQVMGEGPPDLVVAPGLISHVDLHWTHPTFPHFVRRLASFARVILFDKRGTGLSDPVPGGAPLDARIDDIRAVMDAAGSERAALLGQSEGGPMSVLFAATWPERTIALVLCGAFAAGRALPRSMMARLDDAVAHWGTGRTLPVFAPSVSNNLVHRQAVGLFERAALSPATARNLLAAIRQVDVTSVLPTIRVPTLVVHRRDDVFVPAAHARELASLVPDVRYVELSGTDHVPWVGDADAVLDEVERFLTGARHHHAHERLLASVLFTDIVGSTEHAAALGDEAWRDLLERHNTAVRQVLDAYGGREIKTTGDGFLAAFDGPARAVRCAQSIIDAVRPLGVDIRGGVHTGECEVLEDGDVGGMAVHIGARVAAAAGPGELLVSGTVRDLVVGSGLQFVDRGVHTLKGVPGKWQLFALAESATSTTSAMDRRPQRLGYADRAFVGFARRAPGVARLVNRVAGRSG